MTFRIRYRGPGSLEQLAVPCPEPEVVQSSQAYGVGEELVHLRPGWFVHEVTHESGFLTLVVELRPPG